MLEFNSLEKKNKTKSQTKILFFLHSFSIDESVNANNSVNLFPQVVLNDLKSQDPQRLQGKKK